MNPTRPSADIIERLVASSSGQFISVSTVVKFITSTRRHPDDSLTQFLRLVPPPSTIHPCSELDTLYTNILSSVADLNKTMTIFGFLIVCENFHLTRTESLEDFLILRASEVELFVGELASVATIREHEDHEFVSLRYASLGNFILEP